LTWTAIVSPEKDGKEGVQYAVLLASGSSPLPGRIGIIGFGFTKLLPVQMPYPGLGLLNTDFGDLTAQKIFGCQSASFPWYQVFAGVVEVLAGTLLLFRRTTTLGAILLFGGTGRYRVRQLCL